VTFFADEGEDIQQVSISAQLVTDMAQVCQEYASHVDLFCQNSCNKECHDAIDAAKSMTNACLDMQVSSSMLDNHRHHHGRHHGGHGRHHGGHGHHSESSSSSSSSSNDDTDTDTDQEEQDGDKQVVMKTRSKLFRQRIALKQQQQQQQQDDSNVSSSSSSTTASTTDFKTFIRSYNRFCRRERHGLAGCSIALIAVCSLIFCCCCRRCYKRRCGKKCTKTCTRSQVPQEMEDPHRVVIAAIVPASMVHVNELVQPQVIQSRVVANQTKQIESDHALAVELSKQ